MTSIETVNRIIEKLISDGWTIISTEYTGRNTVNAVKKYSKVSITTEECLCHGGRMWISDEHCNTYTEISHGEYDSSLGIVNSDTELKYIIDNEMLPALKELGHTIYKTVCIRQNSSGATEEKPTYHTALRYASAALFDHCNSLIGTAVYEDANVLSIGETIMGTYPNSLMGVKFERIPVPENTFRGENRIYIKQIPLSRKRVEDEFTEDTKSYNYGTIRYLEVFKK